MLTLLSTAPRRRSRASRRPDPELLRHAVSPPHDARVALWGSRVCSSRERICSHITSFELHEGQHCLSEAGGGGRATAGNARLSRAGTTRGRRSEPLGCSRGGRRRRRRARPGRGPALTRRGLLSRAQGSSGRQRPARALCPLPAGGDAALRPRRGDGGTACRTPTCVLGRLLATGSSGPSPVTRQSRARGSWPVPRSQHEGAPGWRLDAGCGASATSTPAPVPTASRRSVRSRPPPRPRWPLPSPAGLFSVNACVASDLSSDVPMRQALPAPPALTWVPGVPSSSAHACACIPASLSVVSPAPGAWLRGLGLGLGPGVRLAPRAQFLTGLVRSLRFEQDNGSWLPMDVLLLKPPRAEGGGPVLPADPSPGWSRYPEVRRPAQNPAHCLSSVRVSFRVPSLAGDVHHWPRGDPGDALCSPVSPALRPQPPGS